MHSSRMRTARSLTVSRSICYARPIDRVGLRIFVRICAIKRKRNQKDGNVVELKGKKMKLQFPTNFVHA